MSYQDKQLKKEFITVDNRTIPFGYPQFWGGDDWEVSGRDNPLPVANYTRNEQDLWVPVSNENPVPTQLTGRNVEEIYFFNAQEIRQSGNIDSVLIDLSKYKKLRFVFRSTLKKDGDYVSGSWRIRYGINEVNSWDGSKFNIPTFELQGTSLSYEMGTSIDRLKSPLTRIMVRLNLLQEPDEGSFTLYVIGVPN